MSVVRVRVAVVLPVAVLAFASGVALAQVPVVESAPVGESTDAARLAELFQRLQILQREVRELRGLVEEQAFQIERLTKQQQQHYIDLDQRLLALRDGEAVVAGGAKPGVAGSPSPAPIRPVAPSPTPAGTVPSGDASPPSERGAYTAAFNLMKERRFPEALEAFSRLVDDYPNGQLTPNAIYWTGELHLEMGEVELARQSFSQVVSLYPGHHKMIDSLYKLGAVHHRLQDHERSLEYFNRVIADYPDSSAANLARDFKAELDGTEAAGPG